MVITLNTTQQWELGSVPPATSKFVIQEESREVSNQDDAGWLARIRQQVYDNHPEVQDLYVSIGDETEVDYWIIIPTRDIALVRSLIEDQQKNIISLFARTANPPFQLDFHIIYAEGHAPSAMVPSEAIRIPKF